jgi:hypothetical protein
MSKHTIQINAVIRERGYVLLTSLVFLTILTLVAVVSSQSTLFDFQMSNNLALKDRAFQSSESGRIGMANILDGHVYEREWNNSIPVPAGLTVYDKDSSGAADMLFLGNEVTEDLYDTETMTVDAEYKIDGNADSDYNDGGDVNAELVVYKTKNVFAKGSGTAMVAGYEGLGKGAAAGGFNMFFELRGRGQSILGAQSETASEYRVVVRN